MSADLQINSQNISPSISRTKLFCKRMFAGIIDLLIFSLIGQVTLGLLHIKGSLIFIIYSAILKQYKSTPGGIIAGLKISPLNDSKKPEIGLGKAMWRAATIGALLLLFSVSLIELKTSPGIFLFFLVAIIINILPFFFTEKKLMLHDFIARSFVKNDSESNHKHKWVIWLALVILIIANAAANFLNNKTLKECSALSKQNKYQEVIKKCSKISETSRDGDLNFMVASSYFQTGNFDKAIIHFRSADIYGNPAAQYFLVLSYFGKSDFESTINLSKNHTNDPLMMFFTAESYFGKFEKSAKQQDLMNAAIYSKAAILLKEKMSGNEPLAKLAKPFPLDKFQEKIAEKTSIFFLQDQLDYIDKSAAQLLSKSPK